MRSLCVAAARCSSPPPRASRCGRGRRRRSGSQTLPVGARARTAPRRSRRRAVRARRHSLAGPRPARVPDPDLRPLERAGGRCARGRGPPDAGSREARARAGLAPRQPVWVGRGDGLAVRARRATCAALARGTSASPVSKVPLRTVVDGRARRRSCRGAAGRPTRRSARRSRAYADASRLAFVHHTAGHERLHARSSRPRSCGRSSCTT